MSELDFSEMIGIELMRGYLEGIDGAPVGEQEARGFLDRVRLGAAVDDVFADLIVGHRSRNIVVSGRLVHDLSGLFPAEPPRPDHAA